MKKKKFENLIRNSNLNQISEFSGANKNQSTNVDTQTEGAQENLEQRVKRSGNKENIKYQILYGNSYAKWKLRFLVNLEASGCKTQAERTRYPNKEGEVAEAV